MLRWIVVALLCAVAGLAYAQLTGPKQGESLIPNRYQIVAAVDGSVWRVDAATGVLHRCVPQSQTCYQLK